MSVEDDIRGFPTTLSTEGMLALESGANLDWVEALWEENKGNRDIEFEPRLAIKFGRVFWTMKFRQILEGRRLGVEDAAKMTRVEATVMASGPGNKLSPFWISVWVRGRPDGGADTFYLWHDSVYSGLVEETKVGSEQLVSSDPQVVKVKGEAVRVVDFLWNASMRELGFVE